MNEYTVKQAHFEGPLDLLLQLIEDNELDITSIALAEVTEAYLGRVKDLKRENLPEISDYLVIAARLVLLKSRALLYEETDAEEDADDLAAQLLEYKLYKEMAKKFSERIQTGRSFSKAPANLELPQELTAEGVTLEILHGAFSQVLDRLTIEPELPTETLDRKITIEECTERVTTRLQKGPTAFGDLFTKLRSRLVMIVTFLAILELIKQSLLVVKQQDRTLQLSLAS